MKKLLTLLLTLVMAVCLVNLNNSYTKADEGNTSYTYTWNGTAWSPENPQASYNAGDKIKLVNSGTKNIQFSENQMMKPLKSGNEYEHEIVYDKATLVLSTELMKASITDQPDYKYTYTYDSVGNVGAWDPPVETSYSAGQTIGIVSPTTEETINIYVNGNYIKYINKETYGYTVSNNGTVISLSKTASEKIANVEITDTAPTPTPSPSEPVVKDESCEKVIGPTWHWNNDKGICEEYATVGTSTR